MLKKIREFPYILLLRASWRFVGASKSIYLVALAGLFLAQIMGLVAPFILGKLIDHIQHGVLSDKRLTKGLLLTFAYFMVTPVVWLFHGPARILERRVAFSVHGRYLEILYSKVHQLSYGWHQDYHSGQIVDRIKKSAHALEDFVGSQYIYMNFLTSFFGPLIVLLCFFPLAGVACIFMGGLAFYIIRKFDKKLVPLYEVRNSLSHQEIGAFNDYMANIRTLITLRLGKITQSEVIRRYMAKKDPTWNEIRLNEYKWGSISFAADFFVALLIMLMLVWMHTGTALKIGSLVMLIQYLTRFSGVFFNMGGMYQQLVQQSINYRAALPIEEEFSRQQEKDKANKVEQPSQLWSIIKVENLTFSYRDKMNRAHTLRDLNFELFRGEKIALVGPSGSGKSTLMTLLRGLYEPEQVLLEIDGQQFNSLSSLRDMTTLIPQDPEVFENTILYNIDFGVQHPEEEIMQACNIACFDTVLQNLPNGLQTDIREKGVNLSGGQKQRLALARGVFAIKENSLILMDEPTSSVDTPTEARIFDNLFRHFPGKTIMSSIHRLHLLPLFDRVIVLDKGEIVEQGRFGDLVKDRGLLHDLWMDYQQHSNHSNAS